MSEKLDKAYSPSDDEIATAMLQGIKETGLASNVDLIAARVTSFIKRKNRSKSALPAEWDQKQISRAVIDMGDKNYSRLIQAVQKLCSDNVPPLESDANELERVVSRKISEVVGMQGSLAREVWKAVERALDRRFNKH